MPDNSFDVVSKIELPEVSNAVQQAVKEIQQRFDLKDSRSSIELNEKDNKILLHSSDEFKLKAVTDVLQDGHRVLAVASDTAHVTSMSVWLGGLVMLLGAVLVSGGRADELTHPVFRFSTLATGAVHVHLLRQQITENYRLKLSTEARDEKAEKLLAYITSPPCTDLFDRIVKLTGEITNLDTSETASHQRTWAKRAALIKGVQDANSEVTAAISAIMAGDLS